MDIVELDTRITFQKVVLEFDELHQQLETWSDFFTCWSNLKLVTSSEVERHGINRSSDVISFVVRKMLELKELNTLEYRIKYNNKFFDILEVDVFSKDKKFLRVKGVNSND